MKKSIEIFRAKLQNILDAVEDNTPYEKGVRAVVRALKADYDALFPEEVWDPEDPAIIYKLMEQYCNQDPKLCPICSSPLRSRISRHGRRFLGCQRFPLCQGSRSSEGSPTINQAMRDFLGQKVGQDKLEQQKKDSNRFRNLDL